MRRWRQGSVAWPAFLCLKTEDSAGLDSYDQGMRLPPSPLARDCLLAALLTLVTQLELVLASDRIAGHFSCSIWSSPG